MENVSISQDENDVIVDIVAQCREQNLTPEAIQMLGVAQKQGWPVSYQPGDPVVVHLERGGKPLTIGLHSLLSTEERIAAMARNMGIEPGSEDFQVLHSIHSDMGSMLAWEIPVNLLVDLLKERAGVADTINAAARELVEWCAGAHASMLPPCA